jgi:hypothetical protein
MMFGEFLVIGCILLLIIIGIVIDIIGKHTGAFPSEYQTRKKCLRLFGDGNFEIESIIAKDETTDAHGWIKHYNTVFWRVHITNVEKVKERTNKWTQKDVNIFFDIMNGWIGPRTANVSLPFEDWERQYIMDHKGDIDLKSFDEFRYQYRKKYWSDTLNLPEDLV